MVSMIWGIVDDFSCSGSILVYWMCSLLKISLNLFFTWDSVRPFIMLAISLHLFPSLSHCSRNYWSSLSVHWLFFIDGSIAVNHLSRHCFPFLAVITIVRSPYKVFMSSSLSFSEMLDQSLAPCSRISCLRISSSWFVHFILFPPSF